MFGLQNLLFLPQIFKPLLMKKNIITLFIILLPMVLSAQDDTKFGIKFSGFIKTDFFYDTRQTVSIREGHFLLYPTPVIKDVEGEDINKKANMNFLAIQTRIRAKMTGPDAFGAKTSAMIEGAFFGHSNGDINGFRLRHAFIKLNWTNTELLFGQYWHPLFITSCFPAVISFNTGVPFQPFSRNPQIRLTQKFGKMKLIVAAVEQRDFVSTGPMGSSSIYLRNTAIPDMNLQLHYNTKNTEKKTEMNIGVGGAYKILTPRLQTDKSYKAEGTVGGLSGLVFANFKCSKMTYKFEAVYGQNLTDVVMLGGYAIRDISDTAKDYRDYTTMNIVSFWTDIHTNGKKFQTGVFAGYTMNMGSDNNIYDWESKSSFYTRGRDIEYVYRISPRVIFNAGKTRLAGEIEYTVAGYGDNVNSLGEVQNAESVSNVRFLFSAYYFF